MLAIQRYAPISSLLTLNIFRYSLGTSKSPNHSFKLIQCKINSVTVPGSIDKHDSSPGTPARPGAAGSSTPTPVRQTCLQGPSGPGNKHSQKKVMQDYAGDVIVTCGGNKCESAKGRQGVRE